MGEEVKLRKKEVKGRGGGGKKRIVHVCLEEHGFRNSLRSPRQALSFSAFSFLLRVRGIRLRSLHDSLNTLAASFYPSHRPFISPPYITGWGSISSIDDRDAARKSVRILCLFHFFPLCCISAFCICVSESCPALFIKSRLENKRKK